ncbi:MAG: hypothetical protein JJE52_10955 [Acidimicrobiia bacterium]|nr:hypothetical protein [Acidimicrobiia bacterium]
MKSFDDIEDVPVPDQWDDIVRRAEDGEIPLVSDSDRRRARWPLGVVAAAAGVMTIVGGLAAIDRSGDQQVATVDTSTVDSPADPSPAPDLPVLACSGGELSAGSVPEGAELGGAPLYTASLVQGTATWAWFVGDQQVQLNVPSIPWADEGHPADTVDEPAGTILHQPASTLFVGSSGLPAEGGCDSYDVMVAGGTPDEEASLARDVARSLRWEPVDIFSRGGVHDVATARAETVSSVGGIAAEPGRLESAVIEAPYDERLREVLDAEVDPNAPVYISVVRRVDGGSFVGIDADPAAWPDTPYIVSVVVKGRFARTLRSGFATPDTAADIVGEPVDQAGVDWVPSLTAPPPGPPAE